MAGMVMLAFQAYRFLIHLLATQSQFLMQWTYVMVALAGQPDHNNWDDVHVHMSMLMGQARNQVQETC